MKDYIICIIVGFAVGFFVAMGLLRNKPTEDVRIPVTVEIELPPIEWTFETRTNLKPITILKERIVVDSARLEEYRRANDSLKEELHKYAISKRDYKEIFEDSVQKITVDASVTGVLDKLSVGYEVFGRTVQVDTFVDYKMSQYKGGLILYGEFGIDPTDSYPLLFKAGLDIITRKKVMYGGSVDTKRRVYLKVGKIFDF